MQTLKTKMRMVIVAIVFLCINLLNINGERMVVRVGSPPITIDMDVNKVTISLSPSLLLY